MNRELIEEKPTLASLLEEYLASKSGREKERLKQRICKIMEIKQKLNERISPYLKD